MIGGHDNLVSNGQGGTQSTAPGLEAVELVPQIAAFGARRGNSGTPVTGFINGFEWNYQNSRSRSRAFADMWGAENAR